MSRFQDHLQVCLQCASHPYNLCHRGAKLKKRDAAEGDSPLRFKTLTKGVMHAAMKACPQNTALFLDMGQFMMPIASIRIDRIPIQEEGQAPSFEDVVVLTPLWPSIQEEETPAESPEIPPN